MRFVPRIERFGSTIQLRMAGVGSTLPVASRARTANSCRPVRRPGYDRGEMQGCQAEKSSEQSKTAAGSVEEKVSSARCERVCGGGPDPIVVSGTLLSTVTVRDEVVAWPDRSTARAATVAGPSAVPRVSHEMAYGAAESLATRASFTRKSTRATAKSSEASAESVTSPRTWASVPGRRERARSAPRRRPAGRGTCPSRNRRTSSRPRAGTSSRSRPPRASA